jgi:hypothetical protein
MKPAPPVISIVFDIRLYSLNILLASGEHDQSFQVPIVLMRYDAPGRVYENATRNPERLGLRS